MQVLEHPTVPVGGAPVWSQAVTWTAEEQETGTKASAGASAETGEPSHYCFLALARDSRDEEIVLPPDGWPDFSWRRYRAFLRRHNGFACRNHHLVDECPANDAPVVLPFRITGTPDVGRAFDFEVVSRLPDEWRVVRVAHPALASRLRRYRIWGAAHDLPPQGGVAGGPGVRLDLPQRPRLRVRGVRLPAAADYPCVFRVLGRDVAGAADGSTLAIRQLYRGQEVGRITWRFRRPVKT